MKSVLIARDEVDYEGLVKQAFIGTIVGAAARGLGGLGLKAGGMMVRNPMKTLGAAFTASELAAGTKRGQKVISGQTGNLLNRTATVAGNM